MKIVIVLLGIWCAFMSGAPADPAPIQVYDFNFVPSNPEGPMTQALNQLTQQDSDIHIQQWGGLSVSGGSSRTSLMMAIAGQTGPDIFPSWFHGIRTDIHQGFLYPLNEWIGDDVNGNGQVDDQEAKWDGWKKIPKLWRQVATENGKIYGLPQAYSQNMVLIFRADLVRMSGLDPDQPPQTWDEFYYWCQKLTGPNQPTPGLPRVGQYGLGMATAGFYWLPWMQSDGGSPIEQTRRSPTTGKDYVFAAEATDFTTPEGEDLSAVSPRWRANFAAPEGIEACAFYHRLRWGKWMYDPTTKEPLNLTADDLARGYTMAGERRVDFAPGDVITGVCKMLSGEESPLGTGEVVIQPDDIISMIQAGRIASIDPSLLSWFPFPANGAHGVRVVQMQRHFLVLGEGVGRRPKAERDKIWKTLLCMTSDQIALASARQDVVNGLDRFIPPDQLTALGLTDYLNDIPPAIRRNYDDIRSGKIKVFYEPYMGFWDTMNGALGREVLGRIASQEGESFDYTAALHQVEDEANGGEMFGRSQESLDAHRPMARVIFAIVLIVLAVVVFLFFGSFVKQNKTASRSGAYRGWLPWLILSPALILIALWGYYPLLRGMVMAFQDYRIVGKSPFVGLDNFINLFLDRTWWISMWRTLYFVLINMTLAFFAPIGLALLLTEVPRGKVFYRTLFFLPQVTSGLVITLIWRQMYDPTPQGFFNKIIIGCNHLLGTSIPIQTWLQNSNLAMICCVLPTVWAGMGISSLIYLAALKGVPEEIYEAAEIDGAGIWHKLTKITLPTIFPLILINFVGVFIGTFQSMGNIFLLTFGGPGDATMVAGMRIWIEAYNNLRFSMATSMAWTLGTLLIAFTYLQVRILQRVEFKKSEVK